MCSGPMVKPHKGDGACSRTCYQSSTPNQERTDCSESQAHPNSPLVRVHEDCSVSAKLWFCFCKKCVTLYSAREVAQEAVPQNSRLPSPQTGRILTCLLSAVDLDLSEIGSTHFRTICPACFSLQRGSLQKRRRVPPVHRKRHQADGWERRELPRDV